jgi:hypothetical protein
MDHKKECKGEIEEEIELDWIEKQSTKEKRHLSETKCLDRTCSVVGNQRYEILKESL